MPGRRPSPPRAGQVRSARRPHAPLPRGPRTPSRRRPDPPPMRTRDAASPNAPDETNPAPRCRQSLRALPRPGRARHGRRPSSRHETNPSPRPAATPAPAPAQNEPDGARDDPHPLRVARPSRRTPRLVRDETNPMTQWAIQTRPCGLASPPPRSVATGRPGRRTNPTAPWASRARPCRLPARDETNPRRLGLGRRTKPSTLIPSPPPAGTRPGRPPSRAQPFRPHQVQGGRSSRPAGPGLTGGRSRRSFTMAGYRDTPDRGGPSC
jgi:RNA-binding protein with serine-rich domain 1